MQTSKICVKTVLPQVGFRGRQAFPTKCHSGSYYSTVFLRYWKKALPNASRFASVTKSSCNKKKVFFCVARTNVIQKSLISYSKLMIDCRRLQFSCNVGGNAKVPTAKYFVDVNVFQPSLSFYETSSVGSCHTKNTLPYWNTDKIITIILTLRSDKKNCQHTQTALWKNTDVEY